MTVLGDNVMQNKCMCALTTHGPKVGHLGTLQLPSIGTTVDMSDALLGFLYKGY